MAFKNMADVKAANKAIGHHFFDKDAMRFFNSRIEGELYGGRYFVTSEQFVDSDGVAAPRKYTIREVKEDGRIDDASEFQQFASLRAAQGEAHVMATGRQPWEGVRE